MTNLFSIVMQKLAEAGIENPRLETRMILAEVLGISPSMIHSAIQLNAEQEAMVMNMCDQRLQHKPLDKILGHREFYKSDFKVSEEVLSPRPDTEVLVEAALRLLANRSGLRILDLGTGSGCIVETLLLEFPQALAVAVDISPAALAVAQENAVRLGVDNRLQFVNADWFDTKISELITDSYDLIVSNPPYIPTSDIAGLAKEVRQYDPMLALDGGKNGFDSYLRIAELAPHWLKDNGLILLEAGIGQARQIADIFSAQGLHLLEIVPDLNGIERCVIMQKAVAETKKS